MNQAFKLKRLVALLAIAATFIPVWSRAQDQDLSANYTWAPVQIGAGGWMRGMAVSPSDPTRMYARGDVENLYRWNNAAQTWVPTKLASAFPSSVTASPASAGAGAIAIDATNPDHILVAYQFSVSGDLSSTNPSINLNVYASTDGGVTFTAGNLSLNGNLSSETSGERLAFDPNNGNVAFFGSPGASGASDGLYRTADGGMTWTQVTGGGYLTNTSSVRYESQLPRIDGGSATVQVSGQAVSGTIYITYIKHDETNNDAISGGGVIMSSDGGQTWKDVTDSAANNFCSSTAQLCWATMDTAGNLWVTDGNSSHNIFKLTRAGAWTTVSTPSGGTGGIAVDPKNPKRIFIDAGDILQRSLDGGNTWTVLGSNYTWSTTQTIDWLDPSSFRPQGYYVSESGLYFGLNGSLWQPCGNDGVITFTPNDSTDTSLNPPTWTSMARGIEEMETASAAIPPGGSPVLGVADESEFTITDPDTYTAEHYPIDTWANGGYGLGMSQDIAYAPNAPNFVVAPDVNDETSQGTQSQFQYAAFSNDGGNTWTEFPSVVNGTHPCILYGGEIAVSARPSGQQNEAPGSDNIVWFPTNAGDPNTQFAQVPAPFYSKDGGATWTQSTSFSTVSGAYSVSECPSNTSYTILPAQMGDWIYILAQHQLIADPLTPGTFYLKMTSGNSSAGDAGFWKSTDGGVTWAETAGTTQVPNFTNWGRMAANPNVSGDLWLVDGLGGAYSHGLYHTTNAGASFTRSSAFTYAWQVALGKAASGQTYPAIYVYGLLASDPKWGIFQSVDGGTTFNRISYYPYGIFDNPYDMAASWDTFGTVYVGFSGNSYYYVQYNAGDPQATAPGFTPAAGTYSSAQQVTLSSSTPNAAIYYTIDGTAPTTNSNLYGGAIAVSSGSETINALTVASGYSPSGVSSAAYTINVTEPQAATPTFNPTGGTFTTAQSVTISDTTPNALIYYTTDGTPPSTTSTQYSTAISVSTSETIQAIAVATGYTNSGIGSAAFVINLQAAATPTFNPTGGTFTSAQSVTISDTTPNALIYYTTDGTPPSTTSTQYSTAISVSTTETIQAIAAATGYSNSGIGSAAFTINLPAPSFTIGVSPASLTIQSSSQGTTTVTVTPTNGFNSAVSFACSGLPSGVSCSFSPAQVTPAGSAVSTQLTIAAGSTVGAVQHPFAPFVPETALAATIFLLGWKRKSLIWTVLIVMATFAGFATASGCGGGSVGQSTQPIQATVTVTATSGTLSQTGTIALTVN
ncbi:MAG: chitobiase/beta-hexosaminidase C-terminal domain-containing protein [Terracidiphilus sp.]